MNDRKLKILFSIIDSYILDGEPIGSKSLADTYNLNVSPATIRNEMSSLEKMGLIEKAHSSSGRLPSDRGYRMFVDYILENEIENISKAKKSDTIINLLDKNYHNAEDIVETATKMLADLTELTAVSMTLKNEIKKIVNMELIQLSDRQLLLLAVFDNGLIVKDSIYLDYEITSDELIFINNALKKTMVGTDINEVYNNLNLLETTLLNDYKSLIEIIEKRLQSQSFGKLNREIQIEGLGNIFNFKEYDDLSKTRDFIKLLDSKEKLNSFLGNNIYDTLDISIGYENELDELKQNTVITSSFKINDDVVGHIGVIGLTRLNYIDVISDIMMISRLLND
ncbi:MULTISPECIES: heat-inducible transcriptional repressor HrcA [Anaerococcus]|uniref:Heat-inducible transcription repressor HrcA n=1 Tax=Anaerococcus octavius TaxID=54007 RepID=A0A2I1M8P1_9FIRM|nr:MULTISPECIES: heat-inducible transcriptional repressor HrcA [Anaerococcus]MDU2599267.1 heat-inducible transcriptional repressor HrcA [Anaerococcus sp.]MDU4025869.1 heat-inducible transcriptional repressor HrcA [Anaerococcus sp.]PKZ16503.1 heat-inducible transcription repressor HrcA [Anaerococcus octavius]